MRRLLAIALVVVTALGTGLVASNDAESDAQTSMPLGSSLDMLDSRPTVPGTTPGDDADDGTLPSTPDPVVVPPTGGAVEAPPVDAPADYQIGGPYAPSAEVRVVARDHREKSAEGRYGICYVNAFQVQPDEIDWWTQRHPGLFLLDSRGDRVDDGDWNEPLLDVASPAHRGELVGIVDAWLSECVTNGYRAVEFDNLDSWTRSKDLIGKPAALDYARAITDAAHRRGLAVAQKNAADITPAEARTVGFDFAVAEDCQRYRQGGASECEVYRGIYGNRMIEIEYEENDGRAQFEAACTARGNDISIVFRDRLVTPRGTPGYVFATC